MASPPRRRHAARLSTYTIEQNQSSILRRERHHTTVLFITMTQYGVYTGTYGDWARSFWARQGLSLTLLYYMQGLGRSVKASNRCVARNDTKHVTVEKWSYLPTKMCTYIVWLLRALPPHPPPSHRFFRPQSMVVGCDWLMFTDTFSDRGSTSPL